MSPEQQGFDFLPVLAGAQFQITQAGRNILSSISVGVRRMTANSTEERPLIGSVFSVYVMAHVTFL